MYLIMNIEELLIESGAVKFGSFTLSSGKKSDYYVDIKSAVASSRGLLKEICNRISDEVEAGKVAGVELGAVPLVSASAYALNLPFVIIRKEEKSHGVKDPIIGNVAAGEEIDIIEDVVTTGASVLRAAKLLRGRGAVIRRAICVVDREDTGTANLKSEGIALISLSKASDIMEAKGTRLR